MQVADPQAIWGSGSHHPPFLGGDSSLGNPDGPGAQLLIRDGWRRECELPLQGPGKPGGGRRRGEGWCSSPAESMEPGRPSQLRLPQKSTTDAETTDIRLTGLEARWPVHRGGPGWFHPQGELSSWPANDGLLSVFLNILSFLCIRRTPALWCLFLPGPKSSGVLAPPLCPALMDYLLRGPLPKYGHTRGLGI